MTLFIMQFFLTLVVVVTVIVAVVNSDPVHIQPVCKFPSTNTNRDTMVFLSSTTSSYFYFYVNNISAGSFDTQTPAWKKRHGSVNLSEVNVVYYNAVLLLSRVQEYAKVFMYVLYAASYSVGHDITVTGRSLNIDSSITNTLDNCQRTPVAENGTLAIHHIKTVLVTDMFLSIYIVSHQQQLDYLYVLLNGASNGSGPKREAHFQTSADQSLLVVLSHEKDFSIFVGTRKESLTYNSSSVRPTTTTPWSPFTTSKSLVIRCKYLRPHFSSVGKVVGGVKCRTF